MCGGWVCVGCVVNVYLCVRGVYGLYFCVYVNSVCCVFLGGCVCVLVYVCGVCVCDGWVCVVCVSVGWC